MDEFVGKLVEVTYGEKKQVVRGIITRVDLQGQGLVLSNGNTTTLQY